MNHFRNLTPILRLEAAVGLKTHALWALGLLAAVGPLTAAPRPATATVVAGPEGGLVLKLQPERASSPALQVTAEEDWARLAPARPGDRVELLLEEGGLRVAQIQALTRGASPRQRLLALLLGFCLVAAPACLLTRWKPQAYLVGYDKRYSNSQVQLVAWFTALATVYIAVLALRLSWGQGFIGGIGLPANLLTLSGFSALTFGGAKFITRQKADTALQDRAPLQKTEATRPSLWNLVQNDAGKADFGDFQMLLITAGAVLIFLLAAFRFMGQLPVAPEITLPDVDSTLLSAFGLGQGAYLFKKAALRVGEG